MQLAVIVFVKEKCGARQTLTIQCQKAGLYDAMKVCGDSPLDGCIHRPGGMLNWVFVMITSQEGSKREIGIVAVGMCMSG